MLLREDLRWGHQCGLAALLGCPNGCESGHHGFAGADVALEQAQHGGFAGQVLQNLGHHPSLGMCEPESEPAQQLPAKLGGLGQRHRPGFGAITLTLLHDQVVGGELIQSDPLLGPFDVFGRRVCWRPMQVGEGLVWRAGIAWPLKRKGLIDQPAKAVLAETLGRRVDGRKLRIGIRGLGGERAVLGVCHLQPATAASGPEANLAEATDVSPRLEPGLLTL